MSEPRIVLEEARRLRESAVGSLEAAATRRVAARAAYEAARDEVVTRQLAEMPLSRLRETTLGGVRFGAMEAAGFTTVADMLKTSPQRLVQIPGVGQHSAVQVVAAARQLEQTMREGLWLRFEVDRRPQEQTAFLNELARFELVERAVEPLRDELEPLVASIERLEKKARKSTSRLRMFFSSSHGKEEARRAMEELTGLVSSDATLSLGDRLERARGKWSAHPRNRDVWADYERRAATYNGLLIEVGALGSDGAAAQGFIPAELADRVRAHPLDTSMLSVSLRGYQSFGAKFALTQENAMLGDEMGLGKTIEALAAMCHLNAQGETHFLVVCPASVLVNWMHEVERHSDLPAVRLHGSDRSRNLELWMRRGGVGVTTFQSARWLYERDFDVAPALLVVDEAHYIKNPRAQRTRVVLDFVEFSKRTLFLTGTPMENRVEEFRTLVRHLQPNVAARVSAVDGLAGASRFRSAVAPVYLRRNQEDVLRELPPRIETEEWVVFAGEDFEAYRDAVASGNFMGMRQAAYVPATTTGSGKLSRLVDIVEEATSNDRKVVVFSFFRGVLDTIARTLDDIAMGPLTGSVPPAKRQRLVDDFTAARHACALVSQIEAGGVGLNIQAASVVILAEPQWKPSTEEQAIARAHRMGQARPVDVHRLFAEDSVDQRMLEILATKSTLFNEYVRRSALKEASPDAVDVSDLTATKEVVSEAEAERRIVEVERRRLGLEVAGAAAE
jgi:SNF2 family DNA or RNA helicase